MFISNQLFMAILVASLAIVSCTTGVVEIKNVEKTAMDSRPAAAVLAQLKSTKSDSGSGIYNYKCTVGTYSSSRLACTSNDSTSWNTPHDVELKLRCPRSGSGFIMSYVEVNYSVSSADVNCVVNEGAVGLGYIGVTINSLNTLILNYSANFYA